MKKLLCLAPYRFLPPVSGGHKAIAFLYTHLSQKTDLICVSTKSNDYSLIRSYRLIPLLPDSFTRYFNPFLFFRIKRLIRKNEVTHLLIEHPYFGWLGWLLKKSCGVQLIIRSHNIEYQRFKSMGKWWWQILFFYEKWSHRRADYNFFITDNDLITALKKFKLKEAGCLSVYYGTEIKNPPTPDEKRSARIFLNEKHGLSPSETILLYNGAFGYKPNLKGLQMLLESVLPELDKKQLPYKLIICGKGVPESIVKKSYPRVVFTGFVEDITIYLKGADIFVNPVTDGGGIKTKLAEALACNCTSVSFASGATGLPSAILENKLHLVPNHDTRQFADTIFYAMSIQKDTPAEFYTLFSWEAISARALRFIGL